jgi:hypothetical protein
MAGFNLPVFRGPKGDAETHAVKTAYCKRSSCKKFGRCVTRAGSVLGRVLPCKPSGKSDLEVLRDKPLNG